MNVEEHRRSTTSHVLVGIISFLTPGIFAAGAMVAAVVWSMQPVPWMPGRWLFWILLGLFIVILIGSCVFTAWVGTAHVVESRRKDRRIELTLLLLLAQVAAVPMVAGLILMAL